MEVVSLALQRAPADREACLRSLCGNDVELFQEASQMVKEEEQMGSFLLQPMIAFQEAVHPFRTGQIIAGRFEILRELGEGGMGIVYEAFDRKRRLRIAIKAAKPGFHRLLSPELEGALTVRHPNVCRVNEIHVAQTEFGDIDFLTMELLEGQTLSAYLKARGKLPEPEALLIARQLCEGISEAHRNGIIHRDLKSANIFLCDSPEGKTRVVITDFGLSGAPSERDDLAGTPEYMAPELWAGSKTSKASDIYALGVVLYQMVADPRLEQRSSCDPWLPDTKGLSKSWIKTLNCCVDPSPEARPNDASQVLAGLQARPSAWRFVLALPLAALIALAIPDTRTRLHDGIWPPPLVRLMVLPASGSPLAPDFNAGVLQDVSNRLSHMTSGSRLVQVIPPGEAKNIQVQTPEQAREARATHALKTSIRREGADFLVEG